MIAVIATVDVPDLLEDEVDHEEIMN